MGVFEAKVTSKGQVTLPAKLRSAMRLQPGDKITFTAEADGAFRLAAQNASLRDLKGVIKSGPPASSARIADWIDEARGRAATFGPAKSRG
jgi:AbrB family looped-hinge helix DNA binding protein